ncbi:unnamed protein product, partial [Prunus brigantina]
LELSIYRGSPRGPIEAEKICPMASDRGKWVVKSAFGIVKHGGRILPLHFSSVFRKAKCLTKLGAMAERKSLRSVHDCDLLGTNIAPTSLDSSVTALAEAE